ncbi:hypothetical protein [Streptomyces sp. NPDC087294]|uniref:hypothetical protein n=1 Tax=Streptomyces sp. NPDC087294 TaxID=3365777 RepID=UPI00382FD01C
MEFTATDPTPPAWPAELVIGLNALKAAAERARSAHDSATMAALSLTREVTAADSGVGPDPLHNATVTYDGYIRHQMTEVLREIAFSHGGLQMSLARVWYRAARAYAYGISCALLDLRAGHAALASASHATAIPDVPAFSDEMARVHTIARSAQQTVLPSSEPYGALPWGRSAKAWHDYATVSAQYVGPLLAELERDAPSTH